MALLLSVPLGLVVTPDLGSRRKWGISLTFLLAIGLLSSLPSPAQALVTLLLSVPLGLVLVTPDLENRRKRGISLIFLLGIGLVSSLPAIILWALGGFPFQMDVFIWLVLGSAYTFIQLSLVAMVPISLIFGLSYLVNKIRRHPPK